MFIFIINLLSCSNEEKCVFNIRQIIFDGENNGSKNLIFVLDYPKEKLSDSFQLKLDKYICNYLDTFRFDQSGLVIEIYKESDNLRKMSRVHGITDSQNPFSSEHHNFAQYVWLGNKFYCKYNENEIPTWWDIGCYKNPIDSTMKRKILETYKNKKL